jgi:hypothetical protein
MQIDMWIARIWEYLLAAGFYWWLALAVLLMLERLAERIFHGFWKKWVDPWFTPDRRKQVLIFFALAAFVIGNFRAFDFEREAKEHAIAERKKPLLDPMILYQDGFQVASIIEPQTDVKANAIVFPAITSSRNLDTAKEFEFRSWKLLCSGDPAEVMTFGAMRQITYPNFICRIEGER